ncbi:MAG: hypothetical protein U0736_25320 [Gemmataceae bacterium]
MVRAFLGMVIAAVAGLGLADTKPAGRAALKPGQPVDYRDLAFYPKRWREQRVDTRLVPWKGDRVVFLTTTADYDHQVMRHLLDKLDAGWALYTELTGRSPARLKQLDGLPTMAAVPSARLTCGIGCGYIGATGIEVAGFYDHDYRALRADPAAVPHYYFYEMGRNFYTFGDRHSLFVTGFAVFMRYVCLDALRCPDPDAATRRTIEAAVDGYARSDLGFLRAFTTHDGLGEKEPRLKDAAGRPVQPSDQPVLYASAMLRLRKECGGDAWVGRFFRQLATVPPVKVDSKQAALRQAVSWLVAASCAARRDLSDLFVTRWRLPLDAKTRQALAKVRWDAADLTAGKVAAGLDPVFPD